MYTMERFGLKGALALLACITDFVITFYILFVISGTGMYTMERFGLNGALALLACITDFVITLLATTETTPSAIPNVFCGTSGMYCKQNTLAILTPNINESKSLQDASGVVDISALATYASPTTAVVVYNNNTILRITSEQMTKFSEEQTAVQNKKVYSITTSSGLNKLFPNFTTTVVAVDDKGVAQCPRNTSANAGQILVEHNSTRNGTVLTCGFFLKASEGNVLQLTDFQQTSCSNLYLAVYDFGRNNSLLMDLCNSFSAQRGVFSFTENVRISLRIKSSLDSYFWLSFRFRAVPSSARPQLEVVFTSAFQGYVQTPQWDGQALYPNNMDSWVQVAVPPQHKVMMSCSAIGIEDNCNRDSLSVFKEGKSIQNMIFKICSGTVLQADLHDAAILHVHFVSDGVIAYTGFRLLFSFHNDTYMPQRLSNGRWNCSVPHWSEFRQHFWCDLVSECVGGEDEAQCPYTSDVCGQGLQWTGHNCVQYIPAVQSLSWLGAADVCLSRGMLLVSLHTQEKWKAVTQLLHLHPEKFVFIGLHTQTYFVSYMYRDKCFWADRSFAYFLQQEGYFYRPGCTILSIGSFSFNITLLVKTCTSEILGGVLCQAQTSRKLPTPELSTPVVSSFGRSYVTCPGAHVTHDFLVCDMRSDCWGETFTSKTCKAPVRPLPPLFLCTNGYEYIAYTFVCDHRPHCNDDSDESFCTFPTCRVLTDFECVNKKCLPQQQRCDGIQQCTDGTDEGGCYVNEYFRVKSTQPPPGIIDIGSSGQLTITPMKDTSPETLTCPETHFQCTGTKFYCLPVYVRCNNVHDCPEKEDELACDTYTCPGFYRCHASRVCVHAVHVCDGWPQCPEADDELLCNLSCPDSCVCHGLAFTCRDRFPTHHHPDLRFLDGRGSGLTPTEVQNNSMLVYLSLAECGLANVQSVNLSNLLVLDLSDNRLTTVSMDLMRNLPRLQSLSLAGNPLSFTHLAPDSNLSLSSLLFLDLSRVFIRHLGDSILEIFPKLKQLNLSGCEVEGVEANGLMLLTELRTLDLTGCPLNEFPPQGLTRLLKLEYVYADNYKLCCPQALPRGFISENCLAPSDEISSCDALLRSDVYRIVLSVFAVLTLTGNAGSFFYRVFMSRNPLSLGFDVFVANLSIADSLMGFYLAMIGIADHVYLDSYIWNDVAWKNSFACKLAGFLSLVSSEVSAFIIFLITLDRCIVIRNPFGQVRFHKTSAWIACVLVWTVGLALAAIPFVGTPGTYQWNFYNQTSICIPLPITRNQFSGRLYAFGIMVVLNFTLFLLIGLGQAFIFWSVRSNICPASDPTKKSRDLVVARRLITVAAADSLCHFTVGILGFMAASGVPISSEMSVAVTVFLVPLNSVLNPYLYTLNLLIERRRKAAEEKLKSFLAVQIKNEQKYKSSTMRVS